MKDSASVIVVGGGPCGMLTAFLLARAGVKTLVLEKKSGISTHPKAMGISRRTAEIYRQIGLIDHINAGSLSVEDHWLGIWAKSLVGEELGRVPFAGIHSPLTPCIGIHCPQTWTEKVLLDALGREPLAEIRFDAEVVSVEPLAEAVRVTLPSGEVFEAPWVVAADGAGSGVRHLLGVETVGPGDMGHFVNVMFRADYGRYLQDRRAILYHALSGDYFENFVAVDGKGLWLMHHFLQPGEKVEDYSSERFAGIIRHVSGLPDEPVEVLSLSPWVMSPKAAKRIRMDRILLAGDAAARLSPAGGLGLNTGMQSAHNLAWKLAAVVRGEADGALLDSYESERCAVAFATMHNTNHNAEEIFAIVQAGMQGEWDKAVDLISHSRRGGAGLGQDLGTAYETGAFLPDGSTAPEPQDPINEYVPVARPGHRAPHLWIEQGEQKKSILDLFGTDFCLLTGRDGNAWDSSAKGVRICRNTEDFQAEGFEALYGISASGAVLVRPDGYVGARFKDDSGDLKQELDGALKAILRR